MAIEVTGLAHYGLRVRSLEIARGFYEKLGFEFVVGPVGPEPVAILHHPCGLELNLILNGADESPTNVLMDIPVKHAGYTHVALRVRSVDDTVRTLGELGIEITEGPVQFPNGGRAVFVRDPDRNVVELNEAPSSAD